MNSIFSQAARMGRFQTVLGKDILVLQRFDGTDAMSGLFTWQVDCLAVASDIDFDALIGTHATVTIVTRDGGDRHFDGIVTEARWLGPGENGHRYRLILRPWLFLATLRRNQRIFHRQTVVQILEELLGHYGDAGGIDVKLYGDYPELEYTVQYRESDFDFASRMMERFGISYHFRHGDGEHTMVLSDAVEAHATLGARPIKPYDGHHQEDIEHFWQWRPARRITTGAIRLTDYNFKRPLAAMEADQTGDAAYSQGKIESFDYPGAYLDQGQGKLVAALRSRAERGQDRRYEAEGDIPVLGSGVRVKLSGDEVPGTGEEYLCLVANHSYRSDNYGSGGQDGEYAFYGSYVLAPATAPMVPEQKTRRAIVEGPQTARVVGEGKIDCDEFGRILVQFHWDLIGAWSMRCRVSQNWAGGGWGGMVIPRIGMEVLVEFLEGDPDQPLVTGCVFNGKNGTPYPLPVHKTKAVFRSNSHQGTGFNEITFEDETGIENISLHAQKDQTLKVLHNRMKRIDNDQVESVGRNKSIEIGNNHQEKIGGSMNLTIGGGGGAATAMGLGAVMGQAINTMGDALSEVNNPLIAGFATGMAVLAGMGERKSLPANAGFLAAGQHRAVAGAEQVATGTAVGDVVDSVLPMSGLLNVVVEKARSDTIGLARTEQIGMFKNTMVGMVQNTYVGSKQLNTIGEEQHLKVGAVKTAQIGKEYTTHAGELSGHSSGKLFTIASEEKFEGSSKVWEIKADDKLLISAPGGYIEISKSGIRIRGLKVDIEGNMVNFSRGGPGEGSKCLRAMAKSATPFVR